jgi:hypothetical protein
MVLWAIEWKDAGGRGRCRGRRRGCRILIGEERVEDMHKDGNLEDSPYLTCGSCKIVGLRRWSERKSSRTNTAKQRAMFIILKTMLTVRGTCSNVH